MARALARQLRQLRTFGVGAAHAVHVDVAGAHRERANKNRVGKNRIGGSVWVGLGRFGFGDGERNGLWDGNGPWGTEESGGDLAWSLELEGTVGKKGAFGSSEGLYVRYGSWSRCW